MIAIRKRIRHASNVQHDGQFLEMVPAIERHARLVFYNLQAQSYEEAICAVLTDAFCAFRRLVELGKHDIANAISLARFAVVRYRAGRSIVNGLSSRDVFAFVAQRRRGFCLHSLDAACCSNIWADVLADDTLTPIPDQVAFRLDFPVWLRQLNSRDRKLAKYLALGYTTTEAARQFGVTLGRISQLRSELQASWRAYQQDEPRKPRTIDRKLS